MPEQQTAETKPIEIKLGDGTVVKANTMEEAFQVVAKMKEDTAAALREERGEREKLAASVASLQSQVAAEQQRQRPAGGFDKNEYYRLLNDDPIAAQNYMDAHRFGIGDPNLVAPTFAQMNEDVGRLRQETIAAAFIQQHADDFPATPESAKALRARVESLVTGQGFALSLDTLNYAYSQLVAESIIKPLEKEPEKREVANPVLIGAGSTGAADDEVAKVDKMDDSQLESYLRSKGMLG